MKLVYSSLLFEVSELLASMNPNSFLTGGAVLDKFGVTDKAS